MAAYGVGSSGAALTFGGPSAFLDVAKAPAAQQQPSLRNQLLGNIIEQTRLIDTLFSELVASPRSSSGVNADTPHDPPQAGLIAIYTSLAHTSAEQAELVERARVHQARYEHLASRTRRRVDRVERAVTGAHHQQQQGGGRGSDARGGGAGVLVELADIAREAKELVRKGRKVRESIESAERAQVHTTDLLAYAHLLAPYAAPPASDTTATARLLAAAATGSSGPHFLYPTEGVLAAGRLGEMARGQVLSDQKGDVAGDGGDGEEMPQAGPGDMEAGESRQPAAAAPQHQHAPMPQQQQQMRAEAGASTAPPPPTAATAVPQRPAAPPAPAPFKLDLDSDSDDD